MGKFDGTSLSPAHIGDASSRALERVLGAGNANTYYVDPWSDFYGGNDSNPGTYDKPFSTINRAIDKAVENHGHAGFKRVYVLPQPHSTDSTERLVRNQVIRISTRNLWLEKIGMLCALLPSVASGAPDNQHSGLLITNATQESLDAFGAAGGIDFTADPWVWTGGDFSLLEEADPSLRYGLSDYDEFDLNITIKNFVIRGSDAAKSLGAEERGVTMVWANPSGGSSIELGGVTFEDCGFSEGGFFHNIENSNFKHCDCNEGMLFLNCPSLNINGPKSGANDNAIWGGHVWDDSVTPGVFSDRLDDDVFSGQNLYMEHVSSRSPEVQLRTPLLYNRAHRTEAGLVIGPGIILGEVGTSSEVGEAISVDTIRFKYASDRIGRINSLQVGEEFIMDGTGTLWVSRLTCDNTLVFNNGTLHTFGAVVRGNVTVSATVTAFEFHGDILGNLTLTAGGPAPTIKGRVFGTIDDPDNHLGGGGTPYAGGGNYINI